MSFLTTIVSMAQETTSNVALRGRMGTDASPLSSEVTTSMMWQPWMLLACLFGVLLFGAVLLAREMESEFQKHHTDFLSFDASPHLD